MNDTTLTCLTGATVVLPIGVALWVLLVAGATVTLWLIGIGLAFVLSRAAALGDRTDPEVQQEGDDRVRPVIDRCDGLHGASSQETHRRERQRHQGGRRP
jgi:type IV secretory pathway TrbD component